MGVIQEYIRSSQVFGNTVQWLPLLFGWTKHSVSSKLSVSYLFFKVHLEAHWPLKLGKICSYASRGCEVRGDQSLKLCIGNKGTQTLTTCKFVAHWYKSTYASFFQSSIMLLFRFFRKGVKHRFKGLSDHLKKCQFKTNLQSDLSKQVNYCIP